MPPPLRLLKLAGSIAIRHVRNRLPGFEFGHSALEAPAFLDHHHGPGSSPALYQNLLILVRDGRDQQYIIALDKQTGKTVWKSDRPPLGVHPFRNSTNPFPLRWCSMPPGKRKWSSRALSGLSLMNRGRARKFGVWTIERGKPSPLVQSMATAWCMSARAYSVARLSSGPSEWTAKAMSPAATSPGNCPIPLDSWPRPCWWGTSFTSSATMAL